MSPCHWKTLVPFCFQRKIPENALLTLTVNYPKIVQKNKLCHSKATVNWLFNDMWCYIVIAFFDWKIGVFQQPVVIIYCILKLLWTWSIVNQFLVMTFLTLEPSVTLIRNFGHFSALSYDVCHKRQPRVCFKIGW